MAKSPNQKLKLLYLRDFLLESTDDNHPATIKDMIDMLASHDIQAERKSLYDDLRLLGSDGYGMDIIHDSRSYHVGSRDFELQEVKILVDMVQSSNFIPAKKTKVLIEKLEKLASRYDGQKLQRQVFVRNRVKNMTESVYINVDKISEGINTDRQLEFQYYTYTVQKKRELRHGGKIHNVSPFALIWVDQNYYLLGWNHETTEMRHYRVDRMTNITVTPRPRDGKKTFEKTDMSTYTSKVFSMFTGSETKVRLRFSNKLTDPVLDRFGTEVILVPDGDDHFTVTLDIVVSPQFYAWLTPYGTDAEVLYPQHVRDGFRQHLQEILSLYNPKDENP